MHVSTRNEPMLISSLIHETDRSFIESALSSGDSYVLSGLALNKNLTQHDYARLFENGKTHTRETLTQNPMLPIELLLKLSEDPEDSVRVSALKNERIPLDTLKYKVNLRSS